MDQVRVEVEQAARRLDEARHVVRLYEDRLLPATRDQLAAAGAGFTAGRNSFLAVIEAEKSLRSVERDFQIARADRHRRAAELDWAVGRIPGRPENGGVR